MVHLQVNYFNGFAFYNFLIMWHPSTLAQPFYLLLVPTVKFNTVIINSKEKNKKIRIVVNIKNKEVYLL